MGSLHLWGHCVYGVIAFMGSLCLWGRCVYGAVVFIYGVVAFMGPLCLFMGLLRLWGRCVYGAVVAFRVEVKIWGFWASSGRVRAELRRGASPAGGGGVMWKSEAKRA